MVLRTSVRRAVSAALTVLIAGIAFVAPASAAPGDPLYLAVTKTVSNATPAPGEPFTYTVRVVCSERSCLDAKLVDPLPAELAGFTLLSADFSPSESSIPRNVTWTVGGATSSTPPATVTADTSFTVDFTGAVSVPSGTGLQFGNTFTALLTLQAPVDLGPGVLVATNTAYTTATNSAPDSDSAVITISVDQQLDVKASKTWSPASRSFQAGAPSTIVIGGTNASNIEVASLSLQEPTAAPEGASTLAASNPFTITDFDGFGTSTTPDGAENVQVDAYVFSGGAWTWVQGAPTALPAALALPAGVTNADVGGLRVTYTGAAIDHAASTRIPLNLTQRATDRDSSTDLSLAAHQVNNQVIATVTAPGLDPATATATASHRITPPSVAVTAGKSFSPNRIAAGAVTTMRLTATNQSDVGVATLSLSDQGFFTSDLEFAGFGPTFTWPQGATDAVVTYTLRAGGTETENLTAPATPSGPSAPISGFAIDFSAATGVIAAGTAATVHVQVDTSENATASSATVRVPNTVDAAVKATNGVTAEDDASATLTLVRPAITATMTKTILPSGPVTPGDRVVAALQSRVVATSDYITVDRIVVEDAWAGNNTFWDAFTLDSVAGTQVPANGALLIEARDASGSWYPVATFAEQASPYLAALDAAEIDAALAASSLDHTDVVGMRFTFTSSVGFAQDTTVTPYVVAHARDTLRSGPAVTSGTGASAAFRNTATVTGGGDTPEGTPLTGTGSAGASGTVTTPAGDGSVGIRKTWNQATTSAQANQSSDTRLDWSVDEGYDTVVIEDMGDGSALANSVYDAFDLTRILPISASSTPFSAAWYLRYDSISSIELWDGTQWTAVTAPASGWIVNGAFAGYTLTSAQQASTQGVRITLVENTAARHAAATLGASYDPYAPAAGTGVASSTNNRAFTLRWALRDKTRAAGDWVTGERQYNATAAGEVNNVVTLSATNAGGTDTAQASDTIQITDPSSGVRVSKTVNPASEMYVPDYGSAPASSYPTARFTIEAYNNSVAPAAYVRVMDSPACDDTAAITLCESPGTAAGATADPFDTSIDWLGRAGGNNVMDRFTITNVDFAASIGSQVSMANSVVWLLHYSGGTYSTTQSTAALVGAMSAAQLADVVAVSVTFQPALPATSGGTITSSNRLTTVIDVQVRDTLRVSGDVQDIAANEQIAAPNSAFAQSYDPVLNNGETNGARASATALLTGGDINVGATKSVTPSLITEPTRNDPVTVVIGANQGSSPASTLAPAEVRLTDSIDTAPEFWDEFSFAGLNSITAPAGSDRVSIQVYGPFGPGGADMWISSGPQAIAGAVMPVDAAQYDLVEGVHFVFSRADGGFFSTAVPAPAWNASISFEAVLRQAHRSDGTEIELTGSINNTVEVVSDRLNGESSVVRSAADAVALSLGTFELEVQKVANNGVHSASAGESIPWDLTFTNAGTGYLSVESLTDELPAELLYLGDTAPVYTPDPAGTLGSPTSVTVAGRDVTFTWPAGGRTMTPGETFSVRIMLELQPGLLAGQRTTNTMVVTTAETLDRCGPVTSGGAVTSDWLQDPTTCGASDYVTPTVGPNLFTVKGVMGAMDGAINPVDPTLVCVPTLTATGGDYYRSPCAANSVIGGVDQWVLRVQNAGTTGVSEVEVFDSLPALGDAFLISGGDRGSDFRPQMLGDLDVSMPAGATYTLSVTTSPDACQGTWGGLETHEPCVQNGEVWSPVTASTEWGEVTGIRVVIDLSGTASGVLRPGDVVDVTYSTRNVPQSAAATDGASVDVPADDDYAWNQFGVKYRDQGAQESRKIAPAHVGIHLLTGAIEVHKEFTGVGAGLAPRSIAADVVCTIEGVTMNMGASATLNLTSAQGYVARVDGIPVGATCVVSEQGNVGAYFEVSRPADDVPVVVSQAVARTAEVPEGQIATLINEYQPVRAFPEEDPPVLAFTGVEGLGRELLLMALLVMLGAGLVVWSVRRSTNN